ncbi:hypothetical protein QCM79_42055, partial [Bradyrhizobium sp. SSUT77]|nr:hypothetical protein [Bradyrhizobium sp. SSUT77]
MDFARFVREHPLEEWYQRKIAPLAEPNTWGERLGSIGSVMARRSKGAVAELVGIEVGVVSGVINLESSGVEASDWRLRHEQAYHEAC